MDITTALEAMELTEDLSLKCIEYAKHREEAGNAKKDLDILLASKYLSDFRSVKKNLGYEMSILMLIEAEPTARAIYATYITSEAKYKGLERIIDAYQSKLSFIQSVLKYQLKGEGNG